jgi:transposase-like protein
VMERSHIPLHKWMQGFHLMTASKKGVSAHQLHRMLDMTYEAAWFMAHRIREAMTETKGAANPIGGEGKIVEADETYFGQNADEKPMPAYRKGRPYQKGSRGPRNKRAIVSLVERGGKVRSFHVDRADSKTIADILFTNVPRETILHTDESSLYTKLGKEFSTHETVKHAAGEYARGKVHTNTIEGFFSIFKRGMKGVYQHCGEQHLHRYLAEFDFRNNTRISVGYNDTMRSEAALKGIVGKRLMYRRPDEAKVS